MEVGMSVETATPVSNAAPPKPLPFPHHYQVRLEGWGAGGMLSAGPRPVVLGGAPPEFGGRDDWWSPEHLLLASASLCLKATFEALARLKHLEVKGYQSETRALLDKGPSGPAFSWIRIAVDLEVPHGDEERAQTLLEKAEHHCIVANSLKVEIQLEANVKGV
jgi:organic hydroperoxide reductase OsmC/OhrA